MMTNRALLMAAALAATLPAMAHAAPAQRFLQDAVAGDNGEVANGRMAQQQGASPGVKDFGRTLKRDHAAAKDQALATARQIHARVDADMVKPEAKAAARRLSRLSGPQFDREFVRAMIADHRKDIAKFQMQARTGDPATRRLARETLPHLQHHLQMALALQRGR